MARSKLEELEEHLAAERLRILDQLAQLDPMDRPAQDAVARLGHVQSSLTAVREVMAGQQPHVGTGGEQPLL